MILSSLSRCADALVGTLATLLKSSGEPTPAASGHLDADKARDQPKQVDHLHRPVAPWRPVRERIGPWTSGALLGLSVALASSTSAQAQIVFTFDGVSGSGETTVTFSGSSTAQTEYDFEETEGVICFDACTHDIIETDIGPDAIFTTTLADSAPYCTFEGTQYDVVVTGEFALSITPEGGAPDSFEFEFANLFPGGSDLSFSVGDTVACFGSATFPIDIDDINIADNAVKEELKNGAGGLSFQFQMANYPPTWDTTANQFIDESNTETKVAELSATDETPESLKYKIVEDSDDAFSVDHDRFKLVNGPSGKELHFKNARDYENPDDLPVGSEDGIYQITLRVEDDGGLETDLQVSVEVNNVAIAANDDNMGADPDLEYVGTANTNFTVAVPGPLSNDVEPGTLVMYSFKARDASGEFQTYIVPASGLAKPAIYDASGVRLGRIDINAKGRVTFNAQDEGFVGSYEFEYQAATTSDDQSPTFESSSATFRLTLEDPNLNDPVATDDTANVDEDTVLSGVNVTGNDSDAPDDSSNIYDLKVTQFVVDDEGNGIDAGDTFSVPKNDTGSREVSISDGTDPIGTIEFFYSGAYEFTPTDDFHGVVPTITYTVSDVEEPGIARTDTADLVITVDPVNDLPEAEDDTATALGNTTLTVGDVGDLSVNGGVLSNDTDVEGADDLKVTQFQTSGVGPVSANSPLTITGQGTLTVYENGAFEFAPEPGFSGNVDEVTYTIADQGDGADTTIETATAVLSINVLTPPSVTDINPDEGPLVGGSTVTITGSGFVNGGTTVTFGGLNAGSVTFVDSTVIQVTSPDATGAGLGTVDVQVTTANGVSDTRGTDDDFSYNLAQPTVTGISPSEGPVAGGITVTITGTEFVDGDTSVDFGGTNIAAADVTFNESTEIEVTLPGAASAGLVDVEVTTSGGTSSTSGTANDFLYLDQPTVTGLSPSEGPLAGGTTVTINGSGFVSGATTVMFGATDIDAASVTFVSTTEIEVDSPSAGSAGPVNVQVTTTGGRSDTDSDVDNFTYRDLPTVTGLSPSEGPLTGGTTVTITGSGFLDGATAVKLGTTDIDEASVTFVSATEIQVDSPSAGSAGPVNVQAITTGGSSDTSGSGDDFTYRDQPTVTGLSPSEGPLTGGTTVTITGSGFLDGATAVKFGTTDIDEASVTFVSATEIQVDSPSVGSAGTVDVQVITTGGSSDTSGSGDDFLYRDRPTVTGLSPSEGPLVGGTTVTITGSGFVDGATSVTFDGTDVDAVTFDNTSQIRVNSPGTGSAGTVDVQVTTTGGSSDTSGTGDDFIYRAMPAITGLAPAAGPPVGGTVVTNCRVRIC